MYSDEIPVIHHEADGDRLSGESEGESEEEEEEESFEEGTYEAKQGNVSYHCDASVVQQSSAQSGMTAAKSQEE